MGNERSKSSVDEVLCDAFEGGGETTISMCSFCDLRTGLNEGFGKASGVRGAGELPEDEEWGLDGSKGGQCAWCEWYCERECACDGVKSARRRKSWEGRATDDKPSW